ncbi:putative RNA-directed DNA polymerase [Helianthus annuus]|nr:putative RNA-directed DNA polymerase [Helianthus annuus]
MEVVDEGEPWRGYKDKGSGKGKGFNHRIVKFFVSNIPKGCRPWDLANAFRAFGDISGAFIAKKKDKMGRTFGFVSFKGVLDAVELEGRMNNMKLGGNKLVVNVAKFAKENVGSFNDGVCFGKESSFHLNGWKTDGPARKPEGPARKQASVFNASSSGKSFVDILLNKSSPCQEDDVVEVDSSVFTLSEKFGRSLVGRTVDFSILRSINVLLQEAGFKDIVIQYFGGLTVLLSFSEDMAAKCFAEDSGTWARWFSSIDPWVGQSMPFERLAWINIFGVPPHLLSPGVFDLIGGRYGRVVHGSKFHEDDGDLTFDCLGVLTENGNLISGALKLRWQDKLFRVWVTEEPSAWVPDCLGNIDDVDDMSSEFEVGSREDVLSPFEKSSCKEDEEVEENNVTPDASHADQGLTAQGSVGVVPMHGENCNIKDTPVGMAFEVQGNIPPLSTPSRPSFNDHWANIVGHPSSRPRKRMRSGASVYFEDIVDSSVGPIGVASSPSKDKGDFNLNVQPEASFDNQPVWRRNLVGCDANPVDSSVGETNKADIPDVDIDRYWGRSGWAKEAVNPTGRSGGLLCVWDPGLFCLSSVVKDPNFLLLVGRVKGCSMEVCILNIYAPQKSADKRALWQRLLVEKAGRNGLWVLLGDFNVVRRAEERKNSRFKARCARDFNQFIHDADLCDFDLKGSRFTFMVESENGRKFSKIDRILVCKNFQNLWPEAFVRALPRAHSDHNPLLLVIKDLNFGAKPFRFFSSWLERPDFAFVVESAIANFSAEGPPDLILSLKLRFLRSKIKEWRDGLRRKEGEEEEEAKMELEKLDEEMELRELTEEEEWVRLECKKKLLEVESFKAKDMKQRSRARWATDGDDNTKFFHGLVNKRKASNAIPGLLDNDVWVSKPRLVKKLVYNFFRKKFKEDQPVRPELVCSFDNLLSDEDASFLISEFSKEEIKKACFDCGSERAPGPDGFNMKFFKRFWDLFEEDFGNIFKHFFETGSFSRGVSSSFIALIPKIKDPGELGDFRPINLVGIINKVVSKVLANRLKMVIGSVISETQSAFLKERLIMDGPLILNEVLAWARKNGIELFLFKIDFAKAYDNVNWHFLSSIMQQLGFPPKWCLWIHGILSSARSSVLVNGSPTFEFSCGKGMRQGDPISPFLFLLVMEAFSSMVKKACGVGALRGVSLPKEGPVLSHLLYADDCVLIGEWARNNIKKVTLLLRCFYICSGLKINMKKSSLFGVGVAPSDIEEMADLLNCSVGSMPFLHLGILVGAKMSRVANWNFIFDIFESRLALWKASLLSIGGRVTLIKSVLECLPNYYFSLFKAPISVVNKLQGIIKRFLWGGGSSVSKLHWVAWARTSAPIDMGGIGLSNLKEINIALLSKWIWRYRNESNALWRKVVDSIHFSNRSWSSIPLNNKIGGVWKGIVQNVIKTKVEGVSLLQNFKGLAGNGRRIRFWLEPWVCNVPLKDRFPLLFRLESKKNCWVFSRYNSDLQAFSSSWGWSRSPESAEEWFEWNEFINLMDSIKLSDSEDKWEWVGGSDKGFSVGAVKCFLRSGIDFSNNYVFKWSKWVPKKVNILAWRAQMGRIATLDALTKRNCFNGDNTCVMCGDGNETAEHLFCSCAVASEVWFLISRWLKISPIFAFSLTEMLDIHEFSGLGSKAKDIFKGIIMVGWWCIWRARNETRFSNRHFSAISIAEDIKSLGFLWYSNRSKSKDVSWANWVSFSLM